MIIQNFPNLMNDKKQILRRHQPPDRIAGMIPALERPGSVANLQAYESWGRDSDQGDLAEGSCS